MKRSPIKIIFLFCLTFLGIYTTTYAAKTARRRPRSRAMVHPSPRYSHPFFRKRHHVVYHPSAAFSLILSQVSTNKPIYNLAKEVEKNQAEIVKLNNRILDLENEIDELKKAMRK